jgi:hypothetical protein
MPVTKLESYDARNNCSFPLQIVPVLFLLSKSNDFAGMRELLGLHVNYVATEVLEHAYGFAKRTFTRG